MQELRDNKNKILEMTEDLRQQAETATAQCDYLTKMSALAEEQKLQIHNEYLEKRMEMHKDFTVATERMLEEKEAALVKYDNVRTQRLEETMREMNEQMDSRRQFLMEAQSSITSLMAGSMADLEAKYLEKLGAVEKELKAKTERLIAFEEKFVQLGAHKQLRAAVDGSAALSMPALEAQADQLHLRNECLQHERDALAASMQRMIVRLTAQRRDEAALEVRSGSA